MTVNFEDRPGRNMRVIFVPVTIGVLVCDLLTKWAAFRSLEFHEILHIIPGFLSFQLSINRGGVWGFGQGLGLLFILFTIVACLVIVWIAIVHGRSSRLLTWSLALIMGGALGNLWDRICHGGVRDFIDMYLDEYHWPTFNIADIAICVGVGLIILHSFRPRPAGKKREARSGK